MFSRRSYKQAYPLEKVIQELRECSGTQFDPKIAEAAVNWLRTHPDSIRYPLSPDNEPRETPIQ